MCAQIRVGHGMNVYVDAVYKCYMPTDSSDSFLYARPSERTNIVISEGENVIH